MGYVQRVHSPWQLRGSDDIGGCDLIPDRHMHLAGKRQPPQSADCGPFADAQAGSICVCCADFSVCTGVSHASVLSVRKSPTGGATELPAISG